MKRSMVALGLIAFLAGGMSICRGEEAKPEAKPTHESVLLKHLALMEEMTGILATVTDAATAKAALPKLTDVTKRMQENQKVMTAVGAPTGEVEAQLKAKHEKTLDAVGEKMLAQLTRVMAIPDAAKELGPVLRNAEGAEEKAEKVEEKAPPTPVK